MGYDIEFLNKESELRSYFLGLFVSDGWLDNKRGVYLSVKDKQIIDQLAEETNYTNKITHITKSVTNYGKQDMYRLGYCKLHAQMRELGFTTKKTGHEFIPSEIDNTFEHFLRGLSDGDGCFYTVKRKKNKTYLQWELTCASERFLIDLRDEISNRIERCSCLKVKQRQGTKKPVFRIRCNQNDASVALANYMYKKAKIKLDRKFEIISSYLVD